MRDALGKKANYMLCPFENGLELPVYGDEYL